GGLAIALFCTAAAASSAARATTGSERLEQPLDADWRFARADATGADAGPAAAPPTAAAAATWKVVTLPHTFNADDGTSPNFYRGAAWYMRELALPRAPRGRTYLEFDGAALSTDVWVNGVHVGRHEG